MFDFLIRRFKNRLVTKLRLTHQAMSQSEEVWRNEWKEGELTEWGFYKRFWNLKGQLSMIDDILKMLGDK